MKKRIASEQLRTKVSRTGHFGRTGEHCPVDGWWVPDGTEPEGRFIVQGSIMPPQDGEAVTWQLTEPTFIRKPRHQHPAVGASLDTL